MKVKDLAIHGGDVMRILGVPPSRIVGEVLEKLLERVIDDPALNEKEKLAALVPEIANELKKAKKNRRGYRVSAAIEPGRGLHFFGATRRGLGLAQQLGPAPHDGRLRIGQRQQLDLARVRRAIPAQRRAARAGDDREHRRQLDAEAALPAAAAHDDLDGPRSRRRPAPRCPR